MGINKQINKFEICQVVGKCYDGKMKQEQREYKGREIAILYIRIFKYIKGLSIYITIT